MLVGLNRWRITIEGDVPPGVQLANLPALMLSGVTVRADLLPHVRNTGVVVLDSDGKPVASLQ